MSTGQIQVPGFYDNFLNWWHLLYVWRDVIFCPFLSEREEVVEALERVLWEILHAQQADGLWTGGAVQQGDTLEDLNTVSQKETDCRVNFSREVSGNRRRENSCSKWEFWPLCLRITHEKHTGYKEKTIV